MIERMYQYGCVSKERKGMSTVASVKKRSKRGVSSSRWKGCVSTSQ